MPERIRERSAPARRLPSRVGHREDHSGQFWRRAARSAGNLRFWRGMRPPLLPGHFRVWQKGTIVAISRAGRRIDSLRAWHTCPVTRAAGGNCLRRPQRTAASSPGTRDVAVTCASRAGRVSCGNWPAGTPRGARRPRRRRPGSARMIRRTSSPRSGTGSARSAARCATTAAATRISRCTSPRPTPSAARADPPARRCAPEAVPMGRRMPVGSGVVPRQQCTGPGAGDPVPGPVTGPGWPWP